MISTISLFFSFFFFFISFGLCLAMMVLFSGFVVMVVVLTGGGEGWPALLEGCPAAVKVEKKEGRVFWVIRFIYSFVLVIMHLITKCHYFLL